MSRRRDRLYGTSKRPERPPWPGHVTPARRARAPAVGRFICIARRRCRVQSQAIVRWKARLTVLAVVLAVRLYAAARVSYGPVKLSSVTLFRRIAGAPGSNGPAPGQPKEAS